MVSTVQPQEFSGFSLDEWQAVPLHWYVSAEVLKVPLNVYLCKVPCRIIYRLSRLQDTVFCSPDLLSVFFFLLYYKETHIWHHYNSNVLIYYLPSLWFCYVIYKVAPTNLWSNNSAFYHRERPRTILSGAFKQSALTMCWKPNEMASNVVPVETGDGKRSSWTINQHKAILGLGKGRFL